MSAIVGYVRYVLMQNSSISAKISTRIYPKKLPLNPTLPAMTIMLPAGKTEISKDTYTRVSITSFGVKSASQSAYDAAWELAELAKTVLLDHSGIRNGVYCNSIKHITDVEGQSEDNDIETVVSDYAVTWEKH